MSSIPDRLARRQRRRGERQAEDRGTSSVAAFDSYLHGMALYNLAADEPSDRGRWRRSTGRYPSIRAMPQRKRRGPAR